LKYFHYERVAELLQVIGVWGVVIFGCVGVALKLSMASYFGSRFQVSSGGSALGMGRRR